MDYDVLALSYAREVTLCGINLYPNPEYHPDRIMDEHDLLYIQEGEWKVGQDEALEKLLDFFAQRLRALFTGQGFETRVVDAAIGAGFNDIRTLKARLEALSSFSKEAAFEQVVCANALGGIAAAVVVEVHAAFGQEAPRFALGFRQAGFS